jgi:hypothetical protein
VKHTSWVLLLALWPIASASQQQPNLNVLLMQNTFLVFAGWPRSRGFRDLGFHSRRKRGIFPITHPFAEDAKRVGHPAEGLSRAGAPAPHVNGVGKRPFPLLAKDARNGAPNAHCRRGLPVCTPDPSPRW